MFKVKAHNFYIAEYLYIFHRNVRLTNLIALKIHTYTASTKYFYFIFFPLYK